jgi:hypothetical protein
MSRGEKWKRAMEKMKTKTNKKPPKKRTALEKTFDKAKSFPLVQIKPVHAEQRGDDQRFQESTLRAKVHVPGDKVVNIDPSTETKEVPQNEPPLGVLDHPAAKALGEDTKFEEGQRRDPFVDNVSAVTSSESLNGAALPSHLTSNQPGVGKGLQQDLVLPAPQQENEKKFLERTPENFASINANTASPTVPQSVQKSSESATMRPLLGLANPMGMVPSDRQQIKSGIMFNDFHMVAPGFGQGVTNKLFLMNELSEEKIRFAAPLAFPRTDMGPVSCVMPPPIGWQNLMTKKDAVIISREKRRALMLRAKVAVAAGDASTNILGDDFGLFRNSSAKGLPRQAVSPFEPIVLKPHPPERTRPLMGSQLEHQQFRRLFDADRYPQRLQVHIGQEGGSTYSRRSALRLMQFPLGMA